MADSSHPHTLLLSLRRYFRRGADLLRPFPTPRAQQDCAPTPYPLLSRAPRATAGSPHRARPAGRSHLIDYFGLRGRVWGTSNARPAGTRPPHRPLSTVLLPTRNPLLATSSRHPPRSPRSVSSQLLAFRFQVSGFRFLRLPPTLRFHTLTPFLSWRRERD